jgi:outer membrane assembly lipoprotein YfiO
MMDFLLKRLYLGPSMKTRTRFFLAPMQRSALAACVILSACWSSSSSGPDGEAKELTAKDSTETEDLPEPELIHTSKQMYEARMFSLARSNLQSLKDRYPMGAHAAFAEIKLADSYFYNGEYNEAAKFYEAFLKNYPGSVDAPYVELQAARSHLASARGTGRDREPLERAITLYDGVVSHYPGTSYASTAERERVPVIQQLAEYDQFIIDFYKQQENEAAVRVREKQFKERWGSRLATLPASPPEASTALKDLPKLPRR